jgi:hypothetical protein
MSSEHTTDDDECTPEDIARMRDRLNKKVFHQLPIYMQHVGQLRGAFDTALALVHSHKLTDQEVQLFSAIDFDLVNMWGPERFPLGLQLKKVGHADAVELIDDANALIDCVEKRIANLKGVILNETGDVVDEALSEVEDLGTAAVFISQISKTILHVLDELPPGHTVTEEEDEEEEDEDRDEAA